MKRCSSLSLNATPSKTISIIALGVYEGVLRQLILKKHYGDYVASCDLARLWITTLSLDVASIDYLVPIPLHWTRRLKRGFNQAEIIAQTLGTHYSIPVISAVHRKKRTRYQASLSSGEREENIKHSFVISKQESLLIHGKRIILIDDLCTTGATLKEAARILYKAGAYSVNACVMSRTV